MGAGKSTIASLVAKRRGTDVFDLDAEVVKRAGASIEEIFAQRGERGFRALERDLLTQLPAKAGVVALGGGAVTDLESRHRMLDEGVLVTLMADVPELARRVGKGRERPLLGPSPEDDLRRLLQKRAEAYAEAHAVIDTSGRTPESIADDVLEVAVALPVVVPLGTRTYRVEIGCGVRERVAARAQQVTAGRAIVVYDGGPERPWPKEVLKLLEDAGGDPLAVHVDAEESDKTIATAERIWDEALRAGVDRRAIMIGVGGGVVGDLTAFAASTLLRGVALGQVPTTLLAMVDSSVGGKTGFNRPEGKNLVGTFYQPRFVLCDVDTLTTLPDAERKAGLAETVKSAWLEGESAVQMLESDSDALAAGDPEATIRAVRMAVRLKAKIVQRDETEAGLRMLLNLGHTVAHGLEAAANYRGLRHGEAVALGMVAATRVGEHLGRCSPEQGARLVALLDRLGLPTDVDGRLDERVLGFLAADKKLRGASIHFVVPGAPGDTVIESISLEDLRKALKAA